MVISILFPYLHLIKEIIIMIKMVKKKFNFTRVPTICEYLMEITVESYLGKLLFNNMIPVPEGCYHEFNIFLEKDLKYKGLLLDQVQILRSFKNQEDILRRAQIVYKLKKRKSS